MLLILFLYMILASNFTVGKVALMYMQPFLLTGIRMALSGVLLLGYCYFFNKEHRKIQAKHYWLIAQLVLFHIYISYMFEYWSLQYISSFKSCFFFNLSPFITALFAYLCFNEKLNTKKMVGLTIGVVGLLPIMIEQAPLEDLAGYVGFISIPEIVLLCAVSSAAYGWIVLQRLMQEGHYSPMHLNGIAMFIGGVISLMTSFIAEGAPTFISPAGSSLPFATFSLCLAGLIINTNIIFYNLYGFLLKQYSATLLSFAGFTAPLFAALFGWLFLSEQVTIYFFISTIIVLCGLYLFYQEELLQNKT